MKTQKKFGVLHAAAFFTLVAALCIVSLFVPSARRINASAEGNVAKIGATEYATFGAALGAAQAGDTVTLIADATEAGQLEITRDLTIVGGAYTLTMTYDSYCLYIDNNAEVTIMSGKFVATDAGSANFITVNSGRLTVKNGEFAANGNQSGLLTDSAAGSLVIENGKFTTKNEWAVDLRNAASKISGGEFTKLEEGSTKDCVIGIRGPAKITGAPVWNGTMGFFAVNENAADFTGYTGAVIPLFYNGHSPAKGDIFAKNISADKFSINDATYGFVQVGADVKFELFATLTLKDYDGSVIDSVRIPRDSKITKPQDPVRAGYSFRGWSRELFSYSPFDFDADVVHFDTTIYAQWTRNAPTPPPANNDGKGGLGVGAVIGIVIGILLLLILIYLSIYFFLYRKEKIKGKGWETFLILAVMIFGKAKATEEDGKQNEVDIDGEQK